MKNMLKVAFAALTACVMSAAVSANGFAKTNTYTVGQFADVAENAWYANDVKSAYELGFVNGKSDTLYVPEGNVTVAEGITMASRVHSIYNGKTISEKTGGKWYDMYVEYAKANGLIQENQYTNYDRNIMRYEMALLFANAMPESYFTPKNDIKDIPDVAETEDYYDELMMLYRAGVVLGSDDYGNFYATNSIKRSETSAIINRVALPENRVSGTLKEYGNREQAVYLIDDFAMVRTVRDKKRIASGWKLENMGNPAVVSNDESLNSLDDYSESSRVAAHRDMTVQTKGVVKVELSLYFSQNDGAEIVFTDSDGSLLFKLAAVKGKYVATGNEENATDIDVVADAKTQWIYFELDLDNKNAKIVINGADAGSFAMNGNAKNLARMTYATTKEAKQSVLLSETHMYVNYAVNDAFRFSNAGKKPYGWTVSDNVAVGEMKSDLDVLSVKMNGSGTSSKTFEKLTGKFVAQVFVLASDKADAFVALKNGNETAVKVDVKAGAFSADGNNLRAYNKNVWQLIRIEGDTHTDTAVIKINNKVCGNVPLTQDGIDGIEIVNNGAEALWFDDVEIYNTYDYTDYVPTPVPVNDDEWYVGMSVCSLWREGDHYGWDYVSPYAEIEPVLGYYDEGLPEVADWELKFLSEHGYDFQHYCWYLLDLGNAPIKNTPHAAAIIDGYMNAKYSDMVKMSIMWENMSCYMKEDSFFYNYLWPYWCEWFFSDDRYMSIDNKAVFTIYDHEKFIANLGGLENAKKAIAFMREDIKRLGYDGMIILECATFKGYNAEQLNVLKEMGVEALVSYTFGDSSYSAQFQKDEMMKSYTNGILSLVPSIGVGFNDIGWTEGRTPNASVEEHKAVMEWAKNTYLPLLATREGNDWIGKFVFHTTWNEYGEGHYIMPSSLNGFGYVDANRQVFSSVAGKDDNAHFDVVPTDNQKARLGYLYPAKTVPMRREYFVELSSNVSNNASVKKWDFENESDAIMWVKCNNTTPPKYDANEKALVGTTTTGDGNIESVSISNNYIDAEKAKYLHICVKYDEGKSTKIEFFFRYEQGDGWSASRGFYTTTEVIADGTYHDYYIDLSKNDLWKGTIKGLRIDPMDYAGNYYIKTIEFLGSYGADSCVMNVDGTEVVVNGGFVRRTGDEIFLAGNPSDGFYNILNVYHEYNRKNGTLDLFGNNGSKISLTVGSDIAYVDNALVTLSQPVEKLDGLFFVPIKLICDTFGYKYTVDGNDISITVRNDASSEQAKLDNQFEFNTPGDFEGFSLVNATGIVSEGVLGMNSTSADPIMVQEKLNINTEYYREIELRFKPSFSAGDNVSASSTIYFATDAEPNLNEAKTYRMSLADAQKDSEGFYIMNFYCTQNAAWTGIVNTIRFDPANENGYYEIDYLRVKPDKASEAFLLEEKQHQQKVEELMMQVDEGAPFYIENADAEDINSRANLATGSTTVTIVEDDLREGNHAYLLVPASSKKTWCYFKADTRFKAGATYKVEFDLRILTDQHGADGVNVTAKVNPKYTDIVNGEIRSITDHPIENSVFMANASDGWVRRSITFTIGSNIDVRDHDQFTLFVDPQDRDGQFYNYSAMIDNITVSVVD